MWGAKGASSCTRVRASIRRAVPSRASSSIAVGQLVKRRDGGVVVEGHDGRLHGRYGPMAAPLAGGVRRGRRTAAPWTQRQTRSRKRLCPSIPRSFHSPPSRNGPRNITWRRRASAPYCAMYVSGLTTLPLLFDILPLPPKVSMPLARKRVNGSGVGT